MPDTPTKLQRWLDLIAYLAGRHVPVSVEDIWSHVPAYSEGLEGDQTERESVRRKFERDKDELREMGIPIESVTYTINFGREQAVGYLLASKNFHLPYLRLIEESETRARGARGSSGDFEMTRAEARAALLGLHELAQVPGFPLADDARYAFRKLAFDIDPAVVADSPVLYVESPEAVETRALLHVLSDALRHRKQVRFRYHGMTRDSDEERRVYPYGLLFQHGRWYLVAHDVNRDAVRMFRAGRMRDLHPNESRPSTPDYDIPADFDLSEYSGRRAWELGGEAASPIEAQVRFAFPRSLWAERNTHGELIVEQPDGAQLRRFRVHRTEPFLRWILSLGGDATVVAPDELSKAFRALAADVVRVYTRERST